ncbi:alpha/beta hydrolase [Methylomonas sp. SURF-2]|uniref:Alpha/beta hydrolase n=1 Tax=Methylomonas subterranea TaxID=2952225 RepID=A0ABT1TBH4_9GAMM|nr:alpha/beta hydrolase [Methylomonas sp. SURF-2]MCQ8102808.1 alpha/beta hydrolase [Methylomonas sp. SURF-2]
MLDSIGRNWLLLRGLTREAGHWGEFSAILQAGFPQARIHTLDLPGAGERHLETSPREINAIMRSVRLQALQRGLPSEPLTVVGLSLGGMVAWEWMLKHPQEICAAALINTSLASISPFFQRLRWQSYPDFFKLLLQADPYRKELAIIRCVANRRDADEKIALEWAKIQTERPVTLSNTFRQVIAAARYRPGDHRPAQPLLLLSGRGDRLVAPACSDAIQAKWQLHLRSHPWAGHDLTLDDADWTLKQLKDWVKQQSMRTGIS